MPWHPVLVAAVVAAQLVLAAVPGHQAVAARAFVLPAAVAAQNHRREAAPVEEHQGLLAASQGVGDRLQGGGQQRPVRGGVAGVQQFNGRRAGAAGPLAQAQPVVAAIAGQLQGLQGRGGAAVHHRHAQLLGAPTGQVAGVIAEAVLLLQGGVMGFIDDDQAGPCQGREHRRAGADQDARVAFPGGHPGVQALAVGEAGVQYRHRHREALAEAAQGLRREADFRHQHQYLLAGGQHRRHGLQVDLGLAAAGDAVEQKRLKALGAGDCLDGGALLGVGAQRRFGAHLVHLRRRRLGHFHPFHPLFIAQCLQRRPRHRQGLQHGRGEPARVLGENLQGLKLARRPGQPLRRHVMAAVGEAPAHLAAGAGRLALAQQRRQHEVEHFAQGMVVVAGGALAQGVKRRIDDRFLVEHALDGFELFQFAGLVVVDQAHQGAAAERHFHPAATVGGRRAGGQTVVEAAGQGHRQGDLYNGRRRHGSGPVISCASVSSCYDSPSLLPGASQCGARRSARVATPEGA